MALKIEILNRARVRFDAALLRRAAAAALGKAMKAELCIVLLSPKTMRKLNRQTLDHDYATDVLSFDHGLAPDGGRLLEVAICPAVAQQNAQKFSVPATQELVRYVVHGCLHLAGHDDMTPGKQKRMWAAQEKILRGLFGNRYRE